MRVLDYQGIRRARWHRTTIPAKDDVRAEDLVNRDWSAPAPNRKWVTDFTYCRTWAGLVYVAFILDWRSDRIVAWHASTTGTTDLVMTTLRTAIWQRERHGHPTGEAN
jgi:putative transposase